MQVNSKFWEEYPIFLVDKKQLSENERNIIKDIKRIKKDLNANEGSQYHPFFSNTITNAQNMAQTFKS